MTSIFLAEASMLMPSRVPGYAHVDVSFPPGILARGPWPLERVSSHWNGTVYEPTAEESAAADEVIAALLDRGSPAHDGVAARLTNYTVTDNGLALELEEMRWALRLTDD